MRLLRTTWFAIGICALALAQPAIVHGATFCVSTATELQTTLDAAEVNGQDDQVRIVAGLYAGNFRYSSTESHSLEVEGGWGSGCTTRNGDPALTILDGQGVTYTLALLSSSYPRQNVSTDGLTVTGGAWSGLVLNGGDITASNLVVTGNHAPQSGGGIWMDAERIATVRGCRIENNASTGEWDDDGGGGILVRYAAGAVVEDCVIAGNNTHEWYGTGVFFNTVANVVLRNNEVRGNWGQGAAVDLWNCATVAVSGNRFEANVGWGPGGGLWNGGYQRTSLTVSANVFTGNSAVIGAAFGGRGDALISGNTVSGNTGGGIYFSSRYDEMFVMENNVIAGNAASSGAGVHLETTGGVRLINNTIAGNEASTKGGGLYLKVEQTNLYPAWADLYNNIVVGNTAPSGADLAVDTYNPGNGVYAGLALFNNDFDRSAAGFTIVASGFTIDPSNLPGADPGFVAPGDYRLAPGSPCVDAGSAAAPGLPLLDADGNPRVVAGAADIGAYERQGVPPAVSDQAVSTQENTAAAITLTAADADGGPLTYAVLTGPARGTLGGTPPNLSYQPQPGFVGSDSFTFQANDGWLDSNIATVTITVAADDAAPVGSILINGGAASTTATAVTLNLTASDTGGSGVASMRFRNRDSDPYSAWEPYQTTRTWTLAGGLGLRKVYAQFMDRAGNISDANPAATGAQGYVDGITLKDGTAPTGSIRINNGAASTSTAAVTLTLSAADLGGSGLGSMRFRNRDVDPYSVWEPYQTTKPWTLFGGAGTRNVYVQFRDVAGNVSDANPAAAGAQGYRDSISLNP